MPIPISKVKYGSYPSKKYSILYPFVVPTRFLYNKWSYATNKRSCATNWRCATNKNEFNALESIHSRAA